MDVGICVGRVDEHEDGKVDVVGRWQYVDVEEIIMGKGSEAKERRYK